MKLANFFISLQKLLPFLRKSKFRTLDIQISWCIQMPEQKNRNTFYWINWKLNTTSYWNLTCLYHITKDHKNWNLKTSSRPLLCLKRSKHNLYWKIRFLKQATYIRYVITKLSKFIQIEMQASSESFSRRILWKLKRAWN